jgi:hypothetical protein
MPIVPITQQQIVTANLSVTFTVSGASSLKAEIDSRHSGGNAGKTSFKPGDEVSWLLFRSPAVYLDQIITSAGTTSGSIIDSKGGTGESIPVKEFLSLAGVYDVSLEYPYYSNFSYEWVGTPGATVIETPPIGSTQLNFKGTSKYGAIGYLIIKYNTLGEVNRLVSTYLPYLQYDIVVYIGGHDPNL